ncbi:CLK4-associating serine/arginine rich protein-like [Schistocerca serialis cubense]|uniref:CLK4-associating serine/arginine rich protein-like n=1 Tax=Schistocerca serialis cubense TaxID=2023355 RepID=UPI00214F58B1|nr:CLK4-associating serine/arginine rich protein-like [Schistocerca serialis cubense]
MQQEWEEFVQEFYTAYSRLADEQSLSSSEERELFLDECFGMYCRIMEEQLLESIRAKAGAPLATTPPASNTVEAPHRKGKRRQRRRGWPSPAPSSSSSSSGEAPRRRWRPSRRCRRRKLRVRHRGRPTAAPSSSSSTSGSSEELRRERRRPSRRCRACVRTRGAAQLSGTHGGGLRRTRAVSRRMLWHVLQDNGGAAAGINKGYGGRTPRHHAPSLQHFGGAAAEGEATSASSWLALSCPQQLFLQQRGGSAPEVEAESAVPQEEAARASSRPAHCRPQQLLVRLRQQRGVAAREAEAQSPASRLRPHQGGRAAVGNTRGRSAP